MNNISIPYLQMNDGHTVPSLGFGTYKLNGSSGVETMVKALKAGYRLLDSAFKYENEGAVGEAVRRSGIPREQIQVTSKVPGLRHRYNEALYSVEESLYRAGLDYYDFYLIHWPNPSQDLYVEAWQALIEARKRGLVRSIGCSNFLPEHMQRLIDETGVVPAVNQIELYPYFIQQGQREWHDQHGIITQSWSPLGRDSSAMREPVINTIAEKHGRSAAQVILRWHIQLGALPIPKATSPSRQLENLSVFDFELSSDEMSVISALDRPDGRRKDQHPAYYEEY
ncbi:aldo/keto reductase [Desulfovibrio sp. JC010]|uniref:aldo/keto reductase n=1 Tax=Desulfovibrio sp. JC010 TaxID=2593641 RepID=UPI0013D49567|nr:aldo/keto reductase [Desulfovibrio sp. JC010]NDV27429.1 aldo/keto reductase [Desulfovibrio sp. JC010]